MMKNGLTTVQKRLILILSGLLILLGTVIFVFQRNMKQANRFKTDSSQKMNEVNYLSDLQIRVNEMNLQNVSGKWCSSACNTSTGR